LSEKLGQPIAYGRTAEIYAWDEGQVLKLFYDWLGLGAIQYEQRIAQAVAASGLPVPAVGDIIGVNERNGLIYQRVTGVSMLAMMERRPWCIFGYARRMAELHVAMHECRVEVDIPNQRRRLSRKINQAAALLADLRSKVLVALERMPGGNRLCHGDFHPDNILLTEQGEVIIDWMDASLGNPLADLARTTIISQGAVATGQIPKGWQRMGMRLFHARYVRRYFALRPGGEAEYGRWLPVVAAARLSENIPELETWLIAQAEKEL
jgi:Ser/Thr protein kinase RdoA (MazF antagonist)